MMLILLLPLCLYFRFYSFHFLFSCDLPVTQGQMYQVYDFRIVLLENMDSSYDRT